MTAGKKKNVYIYIIYYCDGLKITSIPGYVNIIYIYMHIYIQSSAFNDLKMRVL